MMIKNRRCTERACDLCGVTYYARNDSLKVGMGKYCSKSCQVKQQHIDGTNNAARQRDKHHNWKEGRTVDNKGYMRVLQPSHENANHQGYVLEHRLVMSEHLCRPLTEEEIVHHLDEDRLNNDISNLVLTTRSEHITKYHTAAAKLLG